MKTLILAFLIALGNPVQFDKTVHDFGVITLKDGPQTCTFTITNDGDADVNILAVTTSCGCTGVKWTRETIKPGEKGTVTATYSNDEGAYPFDKTLAVYMSDNSKPTVLHLKGIVKKK